MPLCGLGAWQHNFLVPHLRDQRLARGNVSLHLSLRRPRPSAIASSNKIARSTDLGKMVKEPQVRFKVAK